MAKRWKVIGLAFVAIVVLAAAGITGRVLLLDDGPYVGVADVCAALDSPDAKTLIGAAKTADDPYLHKSDYGCLWRKPSPSDWMLRAGVSIATATFWSGDALDRAEKEFDSGRAFAEEYDPWATDGHTVETIPGLTDEAYLWVSKRHLAKFVQWRMLLQTREENASLWITVETDLHPQDLAESEEDSLLADFRAKAPTAISDLVKALR